MEQIESEEQVDIDNLSKNLDLHYQKYEKLIDAAKDEVKKYKSKVD